MTDQDIFSMIGTKPEDLKAGTKETKTGTNTEKTGTDDTKTDANDDKTGTNYKAPFHVYFSGRNHEEPGMFQDGRSYSEKEITNIMLKHRFFEFSGTVKYDYDKESNTVIAMFEQHKKG
ncbi:MAG: hypothetical protein LKF48_07435 [Prevotella sp.]|jgi:hypothetical protein|nr:hypothetical protein [Prevotella sp.]MCH4182971.1 hypothetical protein [Prevotella sp.]